MASKQARGTHFLESAEGGTIEDTKSKQTREGHSLSGDTPRVTSEDTKIKRASEQGAPTFWGSTSGGISEDMEGR